MMDRPHLNQTVAILIGTAAIAVTLFLAAMGGLWALARSDLDLRVDVSSLKTESSNHEAQIQELKVELDKANTGNEVLIDRMATLQADVKSVLRDQLPPSPHRRQ
jgi:hypothetical protein